MNNTIPSINLLSGSRLPDRASDVTRAEQGFGDVISKLINQTNNADQQSNKAIHELETGRAEHLHEVMLRVEEADISLRMLVQMRNKALTAYEEIMRMQI